jgi:rubrerythrin
MKFTYHTHIHTGGIVLLCHQCNYKWKRPEGEPMSKPCPKCQTPIRVG